MKKYFLSLVAFLLFTGIHAQKTFVNDANAEVRNITGSFNNIIISGGIDLYLSQYDKEAVAISAASDENRQNIKTVVDNNTLKIFYDGGKGWSKGNKKMKVYVSFINLEKLKASGACYVVVAGLIEVPALVLNMNGASDFKGAVKVNTLTMDLSGSSDAAISGSANLLTIESSGASDIKGYGLVTEVCNAKASGASDINITVNKELNVNASGASDVYYKGTAEVKDKHTSGASSVVKKG